MPGKAVGRAAAALPWLCPNTDGLIRLAEAPAGLARPFSADPVAADVALVLFLLRFVPPSVAPAESLFCPSALSAASLPSTASAHLQAVPGAWVDPECEVAKRCRAFARAAAAFARRLAEHTRRACAERAAALAALAPLGWVAVAAVDPGAAREPLHDPDAPAASATQAAIWGLDQGAVTRRLANRWRLPDWVASVLGNFNLPIAAARALVPDLGLFLLAQFAALETERRLGSLGLTEGAGRAELLAELKLTDAVVEELWPAAPPAEAPAPVLDPNPHKVPLVVNLLKMASESRRRNGAALVARLEERLDDLHRAVAQVGGEADARARDAKLRALAELAAGAGHEINNPLAVISGHAQRLYRTEPDPDRGEALQSVIRQTQRITGIVRDLMQFARPPQPHPHRLAAGDLLGLVRDELAPLATEKNVRMELAAVSGDSFVRADRAQIKHALAAVARNGIEAAGSGGWVRLSCTERDDEFVAFVVEDSGPGLGAAALEHAFDPFYCGRSAGRGRGLGLPTAWQFAKQNGGDVRYESGTGPTRFVVTVPRSVTLEFLDRQSA
ncbi:Sensor protein ZraS [Gemmata obscuriglobus]|uniref:sensor histidine kinase n=1 Tax=Gemmata obscuriglobus TaxID=114 RepID=UPI00016C3561|nr:HAMP domain-containing sensor histidine kinase [Gemmata obscuriglobus]QEG30038.1 Sensor protein ZraS [Gemmata obscuriglobus]VTS09359.1 histidine kinase : Histidine kinase OS=Rhodopirellula maiorica SM1 GN=RMSM_05833 PE=4 SV=1: HDOD: HisKA: HATPase_c [Gemmata obscuriglobus UQM 2246]